MTLVCGLGWAIAALGVVLLALSRRKRPPRREPPDTPDHYRCKPCNRDVGTLTDAYDHCQDVHNAATEDMAAHLLEPIDTVSEESR